jgi:hypothetical protein
LLTALWTTRPLGDLFGVYPSQGTLASAQAAGQSQLSAKQFAGFEAAYTRFLLE